MRGGVSISSLNLPYQTMAALCRALCGDGCTGRRRFGPGHPHKAKITDLLHYSPTEVRAIRGIGPVGLQKIRKQLSDRGLVMRGETYGDLDGLMVALACLDGDQLQEVYIRLDELMRRRVTKWKTREQLGLPEPSEDKPDPSPAPLFDKVGGIH